MSGTPTNLAYGINCRADHPNDIETGGGPGIVFCDELKSTTATLPAIDLELTGDLSVGGNLQVDGTANIAGNATVDGMVVTGQATISMNLVKTISSAEILDLHNTPVNVIPAPGAGKVITLYQFFMVYNKVATNYTIVTTPVFAFVYNGTAVVLGETISATGLIDTTFAGNRGIVSMNIPTLINGNVAIALNLVSGKGVDVRFTGGSATTGDGTVTIYASYSIDNV